MLRKIFRPSYVAAATALLTTLLLFIYPLQALHAALRGVSIWWDVLFPALFPFFLVSELMLGFGVVHFFGTLLDPLMRPLFRIPGIGGFVMAMGFASGYPIGAKLTAQLWDQNLVTREEGERLVAITTSADPIFLIGAVSVGFFQNAELAALLVASHYGAAVLLGLVMRFHGRTAVPTPPAASHTGSSASPLWKRAFAAMHEARLKDGRALGSMLREAVHSSLRLMYVVGGLVVFFSVVMETLRLSGGLAPIYAGIQSLFQLFTIPAPLADSMVNGFFEVTLGAKAAGQAAGSPLLYKTMLAAFILSWGGLSVHAQIASLLHQTNLRYAPFLGARLLHAVLAAVLVPLLWGPLQPATAAFARTWGIGGYGIVRHWTHTLSTSFLAFPALLAAFVVASALVGGTVGRRSGRIR